MRDSCKHAILLVEGNTTKTSLFANSLNLPSEESWNPDYHSIHDEHTFYRFLARSILSSPNFKVIQTRDEQGTYRSVGAIGLVASMIQWDTNAPRNAPSAKKLMNQLYHKLKSRGIPWQISRRISEEVVSVEHLDQIYQKCQSSSRDATLVPMIAHSCSSLIRTEKSRRLIEYGTVEAWSAAIHRAWTSSLEDPSQVSVLFEEFKYFANDRAKLVAALHEGKGADRALYESNVANPPELHTERKVHIQCHSRLSSIFPPPTTKCFYKIVNDFEENPLGLILPSIVLQTVTGKFQTDRLVLSVLEGVDLLTRMKNVVNQKLQFSSVLIARSQADQIKAECSSFLLREGQDRSVLIISGLFPALDAAAREVGYRSELKALSDLVIAELMLRHEIVVVHACRVSNDLENIVREFTMGCFYYQLTTRKQR